MSKDESGPIKIRGEYEDVLMIAHDRIGNAVVLRIDEQDPTRTRRAILLQPKEALAAAKAIIGILEDIGE